VGRKKVLTIEVVVVIHNFAAVCNNTERYVREGIEQTRY